jgi:hypothetical protein
MCRATERRQQLAKLILAPGEDGSREISRNEHMTPMHPSHSSRLPTRERRTLALQLSRRGLLRISAVSRRELGCLGCTTASPANHRSMPLSSRCSHRISSTTKSALFHLKRIAVTSRQKHRRISAHRVLDIVCAKWVGGAGFCKCVR